MQPHIKGAHNIFSNQVGIFEGIQRLGFKLYKLYGAILCVFSVVVYTSKATSLSLRRTLECCFAVNSQIMTEFSFLGELIFLTACQKP